MCGAKMLDSDRIRPFFTTIACTQQVYSFQFHLLVPFFNVNYWIYSKWKSEVDVFEIEIKHVKIVVYNFMKYILFNSIQGNVFLTAYGSSCAWAATNLASEIAPFESEPSLMQEATILIPCFGILFGILTHSLIVDRFNQPILLVGLTISQLVIILLIISILFILWTISFIN